MLTNNSDNFLNNRFEASNDTYSICLTRTDMCITAKETEKKVEILFSNNLTLQEFSRVAAIVCSCLEKEEQLNEIVIKVLKRNV